MFFGNYQVTIDDKGRAHIPSVLNRLVGDKKDVMIAHWGRCLAVFPEQAFRQMGEELLQKSSDKKHREKVHRIVSNFFPGTIKNGKLLIPQELRGAANLDKKVQVVGMLKHIEIWDQDESDP